MAGQITRIQNYQTNWPLKVPSWRFSTLCLSGLGEEIVGSLIFMQKVQKQLGWPNDWFTIPKPTGSIHEWWLKIVHFLSLALSGLFKSSLQNSKLCIIYTCIYIYIIKFTYINQTPQTKKASSVQNPFTNNNFGPKIFVGQIPPRCVASHGAFALEVPLPLRRFAKSCCDLWRCSRASGEGHATLLGKPTNRKLDGRVEGVEFVKLTTCFFWVWLFFF